MRFFILSLVIGAALHGATGPEQQLAAAARQRASLESMTGSLRLQQASVRRQLNLAPARAEAFFVVSESGVGRNGTELSADCAPMSAFSARGLVEGAAKRAGIDAGLLQAVAEQESAWHPCAVSVKGAQGLMQLMPGTAAELGVHDPFDAEQSLDAGAALLKKLLTRYSGDLNRVLGAYNAGPARVDAAQGVPEIPETMQYVDKILNKLAVKNLTGLEQ